MREFSNDNLSIKSSAATAEWISTSLYTQNMLAFLFDTDSDCYNYNIPDTSISDDMWDKIKSTFGIWFGANAIAAEQIIDLKDLIQLVIINEGICFSFNKLLASEIFRGNV